ncbi:hypothetical protein [Tellurirhabdus bombi]|uniref:hypothetical protein n=1 Tax=Tellurirhabdus bombi TaxID=2907205 RepID=UPI001F163BAE|nr:hypothetical protein [Tellurirhabdus bombi]
MKQHPVDDLFAKKLNEHSLEPKRANWDEMQKRLHPQPLQRESRIGSVWWYAAAASVLLTLLISRSEWQKQEPTISENHIAAKKQEKVYGKEQSEQKAEELSKTEQLTAVGNNKMKKMPGVTDSRKSSKEQISEPVESLSFKEEKLLAKVREPVIKPIENTDQLEQKQIHLTAVEKVSVKKEPARTLVVQLDEPIIARIDPVDETEEIVAQETKKKRLRLGRLVRQFNNLREGEPLNLKDAGIDPNTILAKASDKVHDGKEKIGESYEQLRSRAFRND